MITRELLASLKGLPQAQAEQMVRDAGEPVQIHTYDAIIPMVAIPGVLLFVKDGIVATAEAGDPLVLR